MVMVHLVFALCAIVLGTRQWLARKGDLSHRRWGHVWLLSMLVTSVSSFWLPQFGRNYSWIHLLSLWVLVCLFFAVYHVKRGNLKGHQGFVLGAYFGTVGAGVAAVAMPNRLLHTWLFG